MKKTILLIFSILLLIACNQTSKVSNYNSEEFDISFNYPSNWELNEDDKIKIVSPVSPPPGTNVSVTIPAESFDEYENKYKDLIEAGRMSVEETNPTSIDNLKIKKYGQHGWLYYLVELDEIYVGIGSEVDWTKEETAGIEEILNSLSS